MKSAKVCPLCEGTTGLPHTTEAECFRAIDLDIQTALARLRSLTRRKGRLLRMRVRRRSVLGRREKRV